jgi:hypothetical protein
METIVLSGCALDLFRRHIELQGNTLIDDDNREPYGERSAPRSWSWAIASGTVRARFIE